jgi:hypothetical protein
MFKPMDKRRLLELAGIEPVQHGPEDRSMSPHHQEGPGSDEPTEEHLDKETSVFNKVHDALEELLDFLQSQEGFEEKRGKEDEYSQMEQDAKDLKEVMKKHLSGYEDGEGSEEGEGGPDDEEIKMVKPKMSFR